MLYFLYNDALLGILKKLGEKDVLAIALTCKKLYSFCKGIAGLWKDAVYYRAKVFDCIKAPYIKTLVISYLDTFKSKKQELQWRIDWKMIRREEKLRELIIELQGGAYITRYINTKIGNNVIKLVLKYFSINSLVLRKILGNNNLVELELYMNISSNGDRLVKIGRSYKKITICSNYANIDGVIQRRIEGKWEEITTGGLESLVLRDNIGISGVFLEERVKEVKYLNTTLEMNMAEYINRFENLVELRCDDYHSGSIKIRSQKIEGLVHLRVLKIYMEYVGVGTFNKMTKLQYLCLTVYINTCSIDLSAQGESLEVFILNGGHINIKVDLLHLRKLKILIYDMYLDEDYITEEFVQQAIVRYYYGRDIGTMSNIKEIAYIIQKLEQLEILVFEDEVWSNIAIGDSEVNKKISYYLNY
jgi:hypothetical protein